MFIIWLSFFWVLFIFKKGYITKSPRVVLFLEILSRSKNVDGLENQFLLKVDSELKISEMESGDWYFI